MKRIGKLSVVSVLLLSALLISCVDDKVCGDSMVEANGHCVVPKDTAPEADTVSMQLQIPENFDGSPVLLSVNYFDNAKGTGMPVAFGEQLPNPTITAGETLTVSSSQANLEGTFYVSVVLYCEGGGDGKGPVLGVDWVGLQILPITIGPGTGTVNAGVLPLVPFQIPE